MFHKSLREKLTLHVSGDDSIAGEQQAEHLCWMGVVTELLTSYSRFHSEFAYSGEHGIRDGAG